MKMDKIFEDLDELLLKCMNTGFDNLELVKQVNIPIPDETTKRKHLQVKLEGLNNLIDNGLVDVNKGEEKCKT